MWDFVLNDWLNDYDSLVENLGVLNNIYDYHGEKIYDHHDEKIYDHYYEKVYDYRYEKIYDHHDKNIYDVERR